MSDRDISMARTRTLIVESRARRRQSQLHRDNPVFSPTRMVTLFTSDCPVPRACLLTSFVFAGTCQLPGCKKPVFKTTGGFPSKYCSIAHKEFRASRLLYETPVSDSDTFRIGWPSAPACYVVRHQSKVTGTSAALLAPRKPRGEDQ